MSQILEKKRAEDFEVVSNERLNEEYFELRLAGTRPLPAILPGQFAEVLVEGSVRTFLRRPISFYDVDEDRREVSLLIRKVGPGTRRLSELEAGEGLNLIYPLGHPFSLMEGRRFLLVGGGVGIAPLLMQGRRLRAEGREVTFLLGFRSQDQLFDLSRFSEAGELLLTTEDGSVGHQGMVTDHPAMEGSWDGIFSCGPEPMMKAVASVAARKEVSCEVSLETLMGCGFGACLCCAVETVHGMLRACVEGPVFNTKELQWQI